MYLNLHIVPLFLPEKCLAPHDKFIREQLYYRADRPNISWCMYPTRVAYAGESWFLPTPQLVLGVCRPIGRSTDVPVSVSIVTRNCCRTFIPSRPSNFSTGERASTTAVIVVSRNPPTRNSVMVSVGPLRIPPWIETMFTVC